MMLKPDLRPFLYWTLHVAISAAPSFLFAITAHWNTFPAIVSMLAGTAAFIMAYTVVWSSDWFRRVAPLGGRVRRALLWGTRLRSAIALLGLGNLVLSMMVAVPMKYIAPYLFMPDLYVGLGAVGLIERIGKLAPLRALRVAVAGPDPQVRSHNVWAGDFTSALPTFGTTVTEGALLTLMLLALSLLSALVLRFRDRRPPLPA